MVNNGLTLEALEAALSAAPFVPGTETQPISTGWTSPRKGGSFVHAVNRQWLVSLIHETRTVPSSAIKKELATRVAAIENKEQRKVGQKEKRELKELIAEELLPRAFPKESKMTGWIDPVNGWICVDSVSTSKAETFVSRLRDATNKITIKTVRLTQSPSASMAGWLADEAPEGFTIDQDGELRSADSGAIKYVHHSLDGNEIKEHLAAGKLPTKLGMTWRDRLSFVMTESFDLNRLSFLDVIKEQAREGTENAEEIFDAEFTLMTAETALFLKDLINAMGGEQVEESEPAAAV